ncbi:MAG: nitrous oxide reductase accessory protein NosL [Halobacteria archaeon]|nr:nitrous oxide reductase accessory protein NosL [Halobacteria archaeon]
MSNVGPLSRREIIKMGGLVAGTGLAGCMGMADKDSNRDSGDIPDPIALSGGKQCDVCGMVIGKHPGPNAQIFYRENSPEEHPNPAWFDSLKACMFPYYR